MKQCWPFGVMPSGSIGPTSNGRGGTTASLTSSGTFDKQRNSAPRFLTSDKLPSGKIGGPPQQVQFPLQPFAEGRPRARCARSNCSGRNATGTAFIHGSCRRESQATRKDPKPHLIAPRTQPGNLAESALPWLTKQRGSEASLPNRAGRQAPKGRPAPRAVIVHLRRAP